MCNVVDFIFQHKLMLVNQRPTSNLKRRMYLLLFTHYMADKTRHVRWRYSHRIATIWIINSLHLFVFTQGCAQEIKIPVLLSIRGHQSRREYIT